MMAERAYQIGVHGPESYDPLDNSFRSTTTEFSRKSTLFSLRRQLVTPSLDRI